MSSPPIRPPLTGKPAAPAAASPPAVKTAIPEPDKRFLERAHQSGAMVAVRLISGHEMVGAVRSFGLYSVALKIENDEIVIYKHSIAMMREKRVTGEATPG